MDIFDYLSQSGLKDRDFNQKTEWLISDFLPKGLITLYWAKGGQGKSILAQAITKHLCYHKLTKSITYIDLDNPIGVLADRGIDTLLTMQYEELNYLHRSKIEVTGFNLILLLEKGAVGQKYKDCTFIIDSLRNVVDVMNEGQVMRIMDAFMTIREAGGTVIILSHANKDGKNYQGSNNILNSIDCMYELKKVSNSDTKIEFIMDVQKERAGIKQCAYAVHIPSLTLSKLDYKKVSMSDYDKTFSKSVLEALRDSDGLNKTELLELIGHKKDDKTARETLDRYDGELWVSKKISNVFTYTLKSNN
jgi:archaellum biogenesis ATPase FlaH